MELLKRIQNNKMELNLTEQTKDFLAEKGYDQKYGARPLRRALQKYVEDELAELILRESLGQGAKITADVDEEKKKLNFTFLPGTIILDERIISQQRLQTLEETLVQ